MDIIQTLARELGESAQHMENVVRLLDEGIPFPSSPAKLTRRRDTHDDHSRSQQTGRCQCPNATLL